MQQDNKPVTTPAMTIFICVTYIEYSNNTL